jgi:hypothetical protein
VPRPSAPSPGNQRPAALPPVPSAGATLQRRDHAALFLAPDGSVDVLQGYLAVVDVESAYDAYEGRSVSAPT